LPQWLADAPCPFMMKLVLPAMTRRTSPPHCGHFVRAGSEIGCCFSNSPQVLHS
jgi:hypothetical protein